MVAGSVVGYFVFQWLTSHRLYAISLLGFLMGYGCGALSGRRSLFLGVVCAIAAAALSIYVEWKFFPFVKDGSLPFFIRNLADVLTAHKLLMGLGVAFGFWFGLGREGGSWPRASRNRN